MFRFVFLCLLIVSQVMSEVKYKCNIRWFKCFANARLINCELEENYGWIKFSKLCDGAADCEDGSDESLVNCKIHPSLQIDGLFYCASGGMISNDQTCDGRSDCVDGSDEIGCEFNTNASKGNCSETEMECLPGECVSQEKWCNHQIDCSNGRDESLSECYENSCDKSEFQCGYGKCISSTLLCDNKPDCLDGADELFNVCEDIKGYKPEPYRNCTEPTGPMSPKFDVDTKYRVINNRKYVWPNQPVHFKCISNNSLHVVGLPWNVCQLNGSWHHALPTCNYKRL